LKFTASSNGTLAEQTAVVDVIAADQAVSLAGRSSLPQKRLTIERVPAAAFALVSPPWIPIQSVVQSAAFADLAAALGDALTPKLD